MVSWQYSTTAQHKKNLAVGKAKVILLVGYGIESLANHLDSGRFEEKDVSEQLRTIPSSLPGSDGPTALLDFGSSSEVLDARLQQQAVQDDNIFNQSLRNSVEKSGYGAALLF